MKGVSDDRWRAAQKYERGFWAKEAEKEETTDSGWDLDFYPWRSDRLKELLDRVGYGEVSDGDANVLEVGSGPLGMVGYFPASRRVAVDPLDDYYREMEKVQRLRDDSVEYLQGMGENLPCESGLFDLAIIENCIDHVRDPKAVMRELNRVLRSGGLLYLTVDCRTKWGYAMHQLLASLQIDAGHPHTFTAKRVRGELLLPNGFEPVDVTKSSFSEAWLDDLKGPGAKSRLKALLGVTEYVYSVLARKEEAE